MSDSNASLVPDVIKSASDAIQANVPETAKQTDGALSTVVGFFNHVVLYPVKKANLSFKYKLEEFEKDLQNKVKDVPRENLQIPPTMIAGPVLEALRYAYDQEELREMYENLLASAMDNRKADQVHPAFVDAIRQMSPLDAQVFSKIIDLHQLKCAEIRFKIKNTTKMYTRAMPKYFVEELCEFGDPFLISASILNLDRLKIIQVIDGKIESANYEQMLLSPYVKTRKEHYAALGDEIEMRLIPYTIMPNDYGWQFAAMCLREDNSDAD